MTAKPKPSPKHVLARTVHLGVRYALPPPVPALTRTNLTLFAAGALLVLLVASGSFLALVYRLRREPVRV